MARVYEKRPPILSYFVQRHAILQTSEVHMNMLISRAIAALGVLKSPVQFPLPSLSSYQRYNRFDHLSFFSKLLLVKRAHFQLDFSFVYYLSQKLGKSRKEEKPIKLIMFPHFFEF
jgi:hypothetical protein